ncbi:MAG TPA: hypothetical protein VFG15_03445 [Amycolatopsis sp.]|nr:hypothetical protein [Amycolatopsis sp.]
MWPFDGIGGLLGDGVKGMIASAFEAAMQAVWEASLAVLRGAFLLADEFSTFTVDTRSGPVSILWPMMLWISGVLALGMFFWQLIVTSLRGGRGFMRLVSGPVQYGLALTVTVGMVAALLAAVDGLTAGILEYGLHAENFTDALSSTTFDANSTVNGVEAIVLGICAFVGVIPAGIGYVLEMLFLQAAVYVLVGTVPVTAAGLLANVSAPWFWRTCRMMLACIFMEPVLALTLVLGVATAGGSQGLSGLLAGVGVLLISLFCPFVLFRLFAFVDPNTDAGAAFRGALSNVGLDSYGANNPAVKAVTSGRGGGDSGDDSGDAIEDANTGRFDEAAADQAETSMDESGVGDAGSSSSGEGGDKDGGSPDGGDSAGGEGDEVDNPAHSYANLGSVVSSGKYGRKPTGDDGNGDDEGDPPAPEPPDPGGSGPPTPPSPPTPPGGGGGGGGSASGGGGTAATAEEAAVIV